MLNVFGALIVYYLRPIWIVNSSEPCEYDQANDWPAGIIDDYTVGFFNSSSKLTASQSHQFLNQSFM